MERRCYPDGTHPLARMSHALRMQIALEEAKLGRLLFNARPDSEAAHALQCAADSMHALGEFEELADLRRLLSMCDLSS